MNGEPGSPTVSSNIKAMASSLERHNVKSSFGRISSQSSPFILDKSKGEVGGFPATLPPMLSQGQISTSTMTTRPVSVPVAAFDAFNEQRLSALSKTPNTRVRKSTKIACFSGESAKALQASHGLVGSEDLIDLSSNVGSPDKDVRQTMKTKATNSTTFPVAASNIMTSLESQPQTPDTKKQNVEKRHQAESSARRRSSSAAPQERANNTNEAFPKPRSLAKLQDTSNNSAVFLAAANDVFTSLDIKIYAPKAKGESFENDIHKSSYRRKTLPIPAKDQARGSCRKVEKDTIIKTNTFVEETAGRKVLAPAGLTNKTSQSISGMPMETPNASISTKASQHMPKRMNPNADIAVETFVIRHNSRGFWYELNLDWILVSNGGRSFYIL